MSLNIIVNPDMVDITTRKPKRREPVAGALVPVTPGPTPYAWADTSGPALLLRVSASVLGGFADSGGGVVQVTLDADGDDVVLEFTPVGPADPQRLFVEPATVAGNAIASFVFEAGVPDGPCLAIVLHGARERWLA